MRYLAFMIYICTSLFDYLSWVWDWFSFLVEMDDETILIWQFFVDDSCFPLVMLDHVFSFNFFVAASTFYEPIIAILILVLSQISQFHCFLTVFTRHLHWIDDPSMLWYDKFEWFMSAEWTPLWSFSTIDEDNTVLAKDFIALLLWAVESICCQFKTNVAVVVFFVPLHIYNTRRKTQKWLITFNSMCNAVFCRMNCCLSWCCNIHNLTTAHPFSPIWI